ncbi:MULTISPECIES: hypothetical protein [unclassified Bradyrhizobium]|nr:MULTISPECIES: hypothetical protein [unclassified Bradyrhizobium]
MTESFLTAAKFNIDVRNLGIVVILIVSAIVVYWFVGQQTA